MKLVQKQRDKLWGETSPYSQVNLIIETRILDDRVSRVFLVVEAEINPFTYEIVKKNRAHFKDDIMIQQLLDNAEYRRLPFGYVVYAFQEQYTDESIMKEAKKHLECTKKTIIKMHKFVMDFLKNEK